MMMKEESEVEKLDEEKQMFTLIDIWPKQSQVGGGSHNNITTQ
jgi:hypothetical protein